MDLQRGRVHVPINYYILYHFLYCPLPSSTDTVRNTSIRLSQQLYETFALSLCVYTRVSNAQELRKAADALVKKLDCVLIQPVQTAR